MPLWCERTIWCEDAGHQGREQYRSARRGYRIWESFPCGHPSRRPLGAGSSGRGRSLQQQFQRALTLDQPHPEEARRRRLEGRGVRAGRRHKSYAMARRCARGEPLERDRLRERKQSYGRSSAFSRLNSPELCLVTPPSESQEGTGKAGC
jgi:hypothetical protein